MTRRREIALLATIALAAGCTAGSGEGLDANGRPDDGSGDEPLTASLESIQDKVFTPFCAGCHAGPSAPVGLRLDAANSFDFLVGVEAVEVPSLLRVEAGDPDASYLIQKLEGTATVGARMPLDAPALPQATIDVVRQWITDGAEPADDGQPGAPPTVVSLTPADGSELSELPAGIEVLFSADMDASLVNPSTFTLVRAGGDGGFDDGNEVALAAASPDFTTASPRRFAFDLTGADSVNDDYRITLAGSGATAIAGVDGTVLDGDGDGTAGGDFASVFSVFTDMSPPTVSVVAPASPLMGTVVLSANAVDDVGVVSVEFRIDGTSIGTSTTAPFALAWDTTTVADGERQVTALAQDAAGNEGESVAVTVTVANAPPDVTAPTITLTAPAATSTVRGTEVIIEASATDDVAVTLVEFFVDGLLVGEDESAPFLILWNSTTFADGDHVIGARAGDAAGNTAFADTVTVTVDNAPSDDTTDPTVMLTAPAPGAVVAGTVTVAAEASDDVGVTEVRFFADDDLIAVESTTPYEIEWTTGADGLVTLTARAADAAANVGDSMPVAVVVNNQELTVTGVDPADGATLAALPASVTITFSEAVDGGTITAASVRVQASGGDGTFDDGNEDDLSPAPVTLIDPTTVSADLTGVASAFDVYRTIVGATVTDENGLALDGNGDGTAGDPYDEATFTVQAPPPTWTADVQPIFLAKCAPCHTGSGVGGHDVGTVYADALLPASSCPGLTVGACTIVRIQNGGMPQGAGCTGDPVQDAGNAACLTQEEQDTVQAWIDAGLPE